MMMEMYRNSTEIWEIVYLLLCNNVWKKHSDFNSSGSVHAVRPSASVSMASSSPRWIWTRFGIASPGWFDYTFENSRGRRGPFFWQPIYLPFLSINFLRIFQHSWASFGISPKQTLSSGNRLAQSGVSRNSDNIPWNVRRKIADTLASEDPKNSANFQFCDIMITSTEWKNCICWLWRDATACQSWRSWKML